MKQLMIVLAMSLFCVGCSGEAEVTFVNSSTRYIHGDVEGQKWGVPPNGRTTRTVEVGGMFSNSSEVEINSYWHGSWEQASPVVYHDNEKMKLEVDYAYTKEFFYNSNAPQHDSVKTTIEPRSRFLAP